MSAAWSMGIVWLVDNDDAANRGVVIEPDLKMSRVTRAAIALAIAPCSTAMNCCSSPWFERQPLQRQFGRGEQVAAC
jgi:hypothetical protein